MFIQLKYYFNRLVSLSSLVNVLKSNLKTSKPNNLLCKFLIQLISLSHRLIKNKITKTQIYII